MPSSPLLAALLVVLGIAPPPPPPPTDRPSGAGETRDPALRALFGAWWSWSGCGEPGRWMEVARSARCAADPDPASDLAGQRALLAAAEALDASRMDGFDRANLLVFRWMMAQSLAPLPAQGQDYRLRIRATAGQDLDPEALHRRGLAEVAAGQRRLAALLGASSFAAARDALRGPQWQYADGEELAADARAVIAEGAAAVAAAFPSAPAAACEPSFGAHPLGQYRPPWEAPGDAGQWLVDSTADAGMPRYSLRTTGFHECWPGHHLQVVGHAERAGWPSFRRLVQTTGYLEGWATYAELEIARDLGLYTGPHDPVGLEVGELHRWARVVVDTGLHHRGWTEEQGAAYLRDHTPLHDRHARIDLERMRDTPGWLIAHALGLDAFRAARGAAAEAAGEAFDPVAFAVFLYELGPVPPEVMRAEAARWGAARR